MRNVKPDVYLLDRDGEMVLVPDFSFEDFERLYQQDLRRQGAAPPPFVLQETRVEGTADGSVAMIEVRCQILLLRAADHMMIPLRLHPGILQDIQYEGPGEAIVDVDRSLPGYVCWLRGAEQSRHTITLKMAVRLRQIGDDIRFELQLPESRTVVDLTTNLENVEVRAGDEQHMVEPAVPVEGGGSRIIAEGLGGDLRLDWRSAQRSTTAARPLISATADVKLICEDPSYILGEAEIGVRADRGSLTSFRVQLPPGMTLRPREVLGYTVQVEDPGETSDQGDGEATSELPENGRAGSEAGQIVRVDVTGTSERSISVQLFCEYTRPSRLAHEPFEAVGFRVLEAFHQRTDLMITVQGEWSFQIVEAVNVRRSGNFTETERELGAVSKHYYFQGPSQTNSLRVALQPQPSLIHVDPSYLLRVREQQVRLDAVLRFRVRGATARSLVLGFPGWTLLDVQPVELLADQPEITDSESGDALLILPIDLRNRPRGDEFELRLSAEHPRQAGDQRLAIHLPVSRSSQQPGDQTVIASPATVILSGSDSLELTPVSAQMPELYSVARNSASRLPDEFQAALGERTGFMFRSAAAAEDLRVVADIRRRPQVITANSRVTLQAERNQIEVRQDVALMVEHKPLGRFQFELAEPGLIPDDFTVTLGGEVIPIAAVSTEGERDRSRFEARLPSEQTGSVNLRFVYTWPLTWPEESTSATPRIPLVTLSKDLPIIRSRTVALVSPSEYYQCSVEGDEWLPTDEIDGDGTATKGYQSIRPLDVRLRLQMVRESPVGTTIRQIWVQSLFTPEHRFDRAVFQLTSTDDRCEVRLPFDTNLQMDDLVVALNGKRTEFSVTGRANLEVPLPRAEDARDHVLEIWYAFEPRHPGRGVMGVDVARLHGDARWARTYWQLVTPPDEHLIGAPARLADESRWKWRRLGYGRQPRLDQAELEAWIGAVSTEAPPLEMNTYLFSSFGDIPTITVRTVSRGLLVLLASGGILLVGLAWIYVPLVRHPAFLLLGAVLATGAGFVQPAVGVLVAQAAAIGFVLCLVAGLLDRIFIRRPLPPPFASAAGSVSDSGRAPGFRSTATGVPVASPLSTTAGPYGLELPSGEPKPSAG